jgi:hypothetical protein
VGCYLILTGSQGQQEGCTICHLQRRGAWDDSLTKAYTKNGHSELDE